VKSISIAWVVKDFFSRESMDRFVTVNRQKESLVPTATQRRIIRELQTLIDNGSHTILIFGDAGIGKTFVTKKALEGRSYIELEHTRVDFPESHAHLLLDDIEFDGEPPRSLGSTIVISKKYQDWCDVLFLRVPIRGVTLEVVAGTKSTMKSLTCPTLR
jgi:hypothetical protein